LPSNELLGNDKNWFPCGILPIKLLYERFNHEREVREVNSCGISPESCCKRGPLIPASLSCEVVMEFVL
jgi:hypothetical protein